MNQFKLAQKFILSALVGLTVMGTGCSAGYEDPLPRTDRLHWPVGLTVHPNGRFLYVVNSNFDTRYREDSGGTISVIDLETQKLLDGQGPYIPSFGANIKLNADASKAYVTARLNNQLLVLDVAENGSAISCEGSSDSRDCALRRVPNVSGAPFIPTDPFGLAVATDVLGGELVIEAAAAGEWRLEAAGGFATYVADETDTEATIAAGLAGSLGLEADQNIITLGAGTFNVRAPEGGEFESDIDSVDIIGLSHLRSTNLTSISIRGDLSTATMRSAEFVEGSNAVALRPGTRDFYAAGRFTRDVAVFQPYLEPVQGSVQALIDRGRVTLNGFPGSAIDARAIAFEPDGQTLYVVTRNPDALHVVELLPTNLETGAGVGHRVTKAITLNDQPSDIVRVERQGKVLLYIPCFEGRSIQVVDPAIGAVVAEVELGEKPYFFAADPRGMRGYVSLFEDLARSGGRCDDYLEEPCGSVGVIDLDPASPRYHRLIRKLY